MQSKGLYFSIEAVISLALILIIFLMPTQTFEIEIDDVFVQQKMHDLLLVWIKQRNFSIEELKSDFEFVFPQKPGLIEVGENFIEINSDKKRSGKKIVEKIHYLGLDFEYKKITLTVFD